MFAMFYFSLVLVISHFYVLWFNLRRRLSFDKKCFDGSLNIFSTFPCFELFNIQLLNSSSVIIAVQDRYFLWGGRGGSTKW